LKYKIRTTRGIRPTSRIRPYIHITDEIIHDKGIKMPSGGSSVSSVGGRMCAEAGGAGVHQWNNLWFCWGLNTRKYGTAP
jgi:hypothetical protein